MIALNIFYKPCSTKTKMDKVKDVQFGNSMNSL